MLCFSRATKRCLMYFAGMIHQQASMEWTSTSCSSVLATVLRAAGGASPVSGFSTGWPRRTPWSGSRSSTKASSSTRLRPTRLKTSPVGKVFVQFVFSGQMFSLLAELKSPYELFLCPYHTLCCCLKTCWSDLLAQLVIWLFFGYMLYLPTCV